MTPIDWNIGSGHVNNKEGPVSSSGSEVRSSRTPSSSINPLSLKRKIGAPVGCRELKRRDGLWGAFSDNESVFNNACPGRNAGIKLKEMQRRDKLHVFIGQNFK
jgi:hypothetical protein